MRNEEKPSAPSNQPCNNHENSGDHRDRVGFGEKRNEKRKKTINNGNERPTQVMGLTLTQSGRFEAPLATYRRLHAADATRSQLGLALPFGWPGWNTHLMLLDLERMRRSDTYRRYLDVQSGLELVRRYELRTEASLPTLDEWLTLAAIEEPGLFHTLPCQWNVQPVPSATPQLVQCRHHIRAMQFELAFN